MMKKVNTAMIAQQLNLSRNTVSRALNGSPAVNEKTKQIIFQTAIEMGYQKLKPFAEPDAPAVEIKNETGRDICLLINDKLIHGTSFWDEILRGIQSSCGFEFYETIVGLVGDDAVKQLKPPAALQNHKPSGIVMFGIYPEDYYKAITSLNVPMVTIDVFSEFKEHQMDYDVVMMSGMSCVYEITSEFIREGLTDIAFVGADMSKTIRERRDGYKLAMADHGLLPDPAYEILGINGWESGDRMNDIVAALPRIPQAMVCMNDDTVFRLIKRAMKQVYGNAADHVRYSGFDDFWQNYNENMVRGYKTVSFDRKKLGEMAAKQILFRLQNPEFPYVVLRIESKIVTY